MGLVVRVTTADVTGIRRYPADGIVLGRRSSTDLVLDGAHVAARHARLSRGPGDGFTLAVLAKLLPTAVNGHAVRGEVRLEEGDVVTIGSHEIQPLDGEPPGEPERRFLAMLARSPNDDDARTVYADWLEEKGRAQEAAFLRLQVAVRAAGAGERFEALSASVRALAPALPLAWRRAVARVPIENCDLAFDLVCPKRWESLARTLVDSERFCGACEKTVYYAPNVATAVEHARLGRCVAVDIAPARARGDLRPPLTPMMGRLLVLARSEAASPHAPPATATRKW